MRKTSGHRMNSNYMDVYEFYLQQTIAVYL